MQRPPQTRRRSSLMPDTAALARLHAASFSVPRPWSATEIDSILDSPGVVLCSESHGFLIGRIIAGEAEVLTLAVDPALRRRGIGAGLLGRFLGLAEQQGAERVFLEVAADNAPAIALYHAAGFRIGGRRKGYYHAAGRPAVDALTMARDIPGAG